MRPVIDHGFRIALRLDAPLDVLGVRTEREQAAPTRNADDVSAFERLVSTLGGPLLIRDGRGLAVTASEVAMERGATTVLIGRPQRRSSLGLPVHRRLPRQLMRYVPDIDLQIVALPDRR